MIEWLLIIKELMVRIQENEMGHWLSIIFNRIGAICECLPSSKFRCKAIQLLIWQVLMIAAFSVCLLSASRCRGAVLEIFPATVDSQEEFERVANSLKPGDELILHGGIYSQNARRAITAKGTAAQPIVIRAAEGESPLLTRPADNIDRHNNIEFVDCSYLVIRGLRFQGGSSGVRFIKGHHIKFEKCEIFETGNNALTMNSGDCDAFVIRRNHIHHTGLSTSGSTEGEGMYIGCHSGSCRTTNTLVEGNYIHHLRGTSGGGNDGIEIKVRSYGNIVRDNVIHDTNIGRKYPGIFVYGGGPKVNIVEGNVIWRAGEGIQVVSDAIVRNNIIFDCSVTGITAAPHAAVSQMRNVTIVNNTVVNHPRGARIRWSNTSNMTFSNNAVYCPDSTAIDASGIGESTFSANYITGGLNGAAIDSSRFYDGGTISEAFVEADKNDFWPGPGSRLIDAADPAFAVKLDFNCTSRKAPFDIGAYESQGRAANPGWQIQSGFKSCIGHTDLRKITDFDRDSNVDFYDFSIFGDASKLPIFEKGYKQFVTKMGEKRLTAAEKGQIIADINQILGITEEDTEWQHRMLTEFLSFFPMAKPTFYLVRRETTKNFLRAGGKLPNFTYDKTTDMAEYRLEFKGRSETGPSEDIEVTFPLGFEATFEKEVNQIFEMLYKSVFGSGKIGIALHEVVEMSLLKRVRPQDPYWRWFGDGFANAITIELLKKYFGAKAAEEFAKAYDINEHKQLEKQINLRYWMGLNFCIRTPLEYENQLRMTRYAYATHEAQRLIKKHGMGCVKKVLDKLCEKKSRKSENLFVTIKETTEEDMKERLRKYQTFDKRVRGTSKYLELYKKASANEDNEQALINVMRLLELEDSQFSATGLQMRKVASLLLFKLGYEKAGDEAMLSFLEQLKESAPEELYDFFSAGFVVYALQCNNPQKAEATAERVLERNPDHPPALTVQMQLLADEGKLVEAKKVAQRICGLVKKESSYYKAASNVLAIDPNKRSSTE